MIENKNQLPEARLLAEKLVNDGVAPDAAVGFAMWKGPNIGWELGAGWSSQPNEHSDESPQNPAPIFDLASLTKPMTALAVALTPPFRTLVIGDVLTEAKESLSATMPIEWLLAHRAGLEAHRSLYEPIALGTATRIDRNGALREVANARRADLVLSAPTAAQIAEEGFPPVYSDLGYLLVGEALARKHRARDAGEAIENVVVRALGLEDELGTARSLRSRSHRVDFDKRVRKTEVVSWRGGEIRGAVHDENAWVLTGDGGSGHAGMFGTVNAVLRFGCAALDAIARSDGPLRASSSSSDEDLSWLVRARPGGSLRAGFDGKSATGSSAGTRCGPRTFGHLGFTGTSLWIDPDTNAVIVVLTNRVHPTRDNVRIREVRPIVHNALFELALR